MQPTSITYSKTGDLGVSHETVSITIELMPGETAQHAVNLAKKFVNHNLERGPDPELARAREITDDPDAHTGHDVKWARDFINKLPPETNEPIL